MTVNLKKTSDIIRQVSKKILPVHVDFCVSKDVNGINFTQLKKDVFESSVKEINETSKPKVSLVRSPVWKCDIPCREEYFYRTLGDAGYKDFLETGKIRPKQNTKANYKKTYFEKGHVNQIYAMRNGGGNYIVETNSPKIICNSSEYPHTDMLDKTTDSFRIWHRLEDMSETPHYEIVYDSMNV